MRGSMEWLWLDPVENEAEWLAPDEWRLRDIDQQIRFYRGRQRFEAEVERTAVASVPPAAAPPSTAQPKLQFGGAR
jgi:hypothetical protein